MSDDRKKDEGIFAPPVEPAQEPGNTVPFVPFDDTANMTAIRAAHRRRASAALFGSEGTASGLGAASAIGSSVAMATGTASDSSAVMASGAATLTLMPDWTALRAEMIGRLDAIEVGFPKIRPFLEVVEAAYRERGQIGHNNPPEPLDILLLDAAELEMGISAASLARAELNAEHPRLDVIRLCGLVLNQMAARVFACLQWIGAKGDVFVDAFLKSAGAEAGKRVVQGTGAAVVLTVVMTQLHVDLTDVATKIQHVFELLHLHF